MLKAMPFNNTYVKMTLLASPPSSFGLRRISSFSIKLMYSRVEPNSHDFACSPKLLAEAESRA
jgi:hypothetical protein